MIRMICLHLHLYLHFKAGGFTVLPQTASCAHDQKYCLETGFRTPRPIRISIHVNSRITKKSDLSLDLRPNLPHIAPRISKQHD